MIEMTARAADGVVGTRGPVRNFLWRTRLAQIGPWLFREIYRDSLHVVSFHRRRDRLHDVALAVASLEVSQLYIDVACLLSPNDGNRLVGGFAVRAMAAGANLGFVFYALCEQQLCADVE